MNRIESMNGVLARPKSQSVSSEFRFFRRIRRTRTRIVGFRIQLVLGGWSGICHGRREVMRVDQANAAVTGKVGCQNPIGSGQYGQILWGLLAADKLNVSC